MVVVDAHTHVFPPHFIHRRQYLAGIDKNFAMLYGNEKAKMADGAELLASMEKEGVDCSIACGFCFDDSGLLRDCNDYLLETSKASEKIVPFIAVDVKNHRKAVKEIERTTLLGAKGIGEIAFYERGLHSREKIHLDRVYAAIQGMGLVTMIHVNEEMGHDYPGKTTADFPRIAELIQKYPSQKTILAHLGGGICFYEFIPEISRKFENTFYDMAASPLVYGNEIYRFIECFLADKTLFGSDYPLLRLGRYREGLATMGRVAQEKILSKNIRRLLDVC